MLGLLFGSFIPAVLPGGQVPAILGGAAVTADTVKDLAKCRQDYDASVEDIYQDFEIKAELECLRACLASGGTP